MGALLARGDLSEALLLAAEGSEDMDVVESGTAYEGAGHADGLVSRATAAQRAAAAAGAAWHDPEHGGATSASAGSHRGASSSGRVAVARRVLLEAFSDIVKMRLDFEGLEWCLPAPSKRKILHGVSGSIQAGRFTAIMGPSGAGKTTFLNLLLGKYKRTAGTLRVNGQEGESMAEFKKLLGFVPQDDTLLAELSVREHVTFAARMRLPRQGWPEERLARHVSAVLDVLGLTNVADSLVGDASRRGISGGQRKRTNIALELVMVPCVLLLDGEFSAVRCPACAASTG
jgi:ABC-type nitrate/sulfonate/bicarbonate transport system ATPase subunit